MDFEKLVGPSLPSEPWEGEGVPSNLPATLLFFPFSGSIPFLLGFASLPNPVF